MSSPIESICCSCIHAKKYVKGPDIIRCDAFPTGVPKEIDGGGNNHHKPFPGDHGIQFECAPEMEPLSAVYLRDQM
jgi:hypothetical protein